MEFIELNNILAEFTDVEQNKVQNYTISVNGLSFLKLRDILIKSGKIYSEDIKRQIYVTSINGGFARKNPAILAISLEECCLRISIFSNEGVFNQHTSEGVINELKKSLEEYIQA